MSDYTVQLTTTIEETWLNVDPVRVGFLPSGLGAPDRHVTVMEHGEPTMRIDVYGDYAHETFCFSDAIVWKNWVGVGFGNRVYLVRPYDRSTRTFDLANYFGYFYPEAEWLLVASASRLFCIAPDGTLHWTSDELGLDGVIVTAITSDYITGDGEWDPPGGWRTFTISSNNGKCVEAILPETGKT